MSHPASKKQLQKMLYPECKMTPELLNSSNFKICIGKLFFKMNDLRWWVHACLVAKD